MIVHLFLLFYCPLTLFNIHLCYHQYSLGLFSHIFPHHIATVLSSLGREIYVIDSSVELLPLDCIPQEAVLGITIGVPFKRTVSLSS